MIIYNHYKWDEEDKANMFKLEDINNKDFQKVQSYMSMLLSVS